MLHHPKDDALFVQGLNGAPNLKGEHVQQAWLYMASWQSFISVLATLVWTD